jgi:hypothetical protein
MDKNVLVLKLVMLSSTVVRSYGQWFESQHWHREKENRENVLTLQSVMPDSTVVKQLSNDTNLNGLNQWHRDKENGAHVIALKLVVSDSTVVELTILRSRV